MKKVIISIIFCFIYAISFAQTMASTPITKSIEIVKPIKHFYDERGKVSLIEYDYKEAFAHISYTDCGDAGNVVEFWIDVDDEQRCFHFTENITLTKLDLLGETSFYIEDESFRYFSMYEVRGVWGCSFQVEEK